MKDLHQSFAGEQVKVDKNTENVVATEEIMEQETDNGKVDKNAEIMIRERPTAAGVKANENTESVVITEEIMEQEADNGKIDKRAETAVDKSLLMLMVKLIKS